MANYFNMTTIDLIKKDILDKLLNKEITNIKASEHLWKTKRQVIRMKNNYKLHWIVWILHKSRWRKSNNSHDPTKYKEILELKKEIYSDYSITMFCEKLEEKHSIKISMPTLRNELITAWLHKVNKRKIKQEFHYRERKENYWEMDQYDWSYDKWLEDRNWWEELCLLVKVDDATGKLNCFFNKSEWIIPTFNFWKKDMIKNWKPRNIYVDRFATYKINHPNATNDKELVTQFWRVCKTLWVKLIFANSPQWKWRVERMNKTLQDRLIKELREANICDIDNANKFLQEIFLPKFNTKFWVEPRWTANLHIPLSSEELEHIDQIFSNHSIRKLKNDFTIAFNNKYYQLYRNKDWWGPHINKWDKITVEEHLDWKIYLSRNWKYIVFQELQEKRTRQYKLPMAPANRNHFEEMKDEIEKQQEIDNIIRENQINQIKEPKQSYFEKYWKPHPFNKSIKKMKAKEYIVR